MVENSIPVLKVAVSPLYPLFDYLIPEIFSQPIPVGARVSVPFGTRTVIGWVIDKGQSTLDKNILKPILACLDEASLFPKPTWELLLKAHRYYHHGLADVIQTGLPLALREGKPLLEIQACAKLLKPRPFKPPSVPELNAEQAQALEAIKAAQSTFACFLLEGVTGSGKTEVYLRAIESVRKTNACVLVLIPEIALTPQTRERFEARFNEPIALYHSQITDKQRLILWSAIAHQKIKIIIGTRSALFLPIQNLGLIILDEEHDASFKQQEGFRYSARDMGVLLAQQQNIPIVLGSATPSFESLYNANQKKYHHLRLSQRVADTQIPTIKVLDVRHKKLEGGLSNALIAQMQTHLEKGEQVLIFLNRRGYAPAWMCFDCGDFGICPRCDRRFTYHQQSGRLRCHHCESQKKTAPQCIKCGSERVGPVGVGTEKIEEVLIKLFPNYTQVRIDKDTTSRKGTLQTKLEEITSGAAQILIGTQLLAKGHHFPNVTLVAIVDVDGGLFSTDFRAVEKMGQLITQVAGRAGRGRQPGVVLLQTCQPTHPLLQSMVHNNYTEFARILLEERKECGLPPFSHFALLRASSTQAHKAESFLRDLKSILQSVCIPELSCMGPVPAPMPKKQNKFRFQLLLQSSDRAKLHQALNQIIFMVSKEAKSPLSVLAKSVRWSIDVDPIEMS